MDLANFRPVIRMVLARYMESESADTVTSELIQSIEIAQALLGGASAPSTPRNVSTETSRKRQPLISAISKPKGTSTVTNNVFKGAILISSAPPVAGADQAVEDDTEDHWESKPGKGDGCNNLQSKLQSIMPKSITVQVPGMDEPITLNCGIGGPGLNFVHVNYTIPGSPEAGPRFTVMTSQKPESINKDAILEDIVTQAAAMYSKDKRVIVARAAPPLQEPDLARAMALDRSAQDQQTPIDPKFAGIAAGWGNSRDPKWN